VRVHMPWSAASLWPLGILLSMESVAFRGNGVSCSYESVGKRHRTYWTYRGVPRVGGLRTFGLGFGPKDDMTLLFELRDIITFTRVIGGWFFFKTNESGFRNASPCMMNLI